MSNKLINTDAIDANVENLGTIPQIKLGEWYWVKVKNERDIQRIKDNKYLACVTHIGSNFAKLSQPGRNEYISKETFSKELEDIPEEGWSTRILFTDWLERTTFAEDSVFIIQKKIAANKEMAQQTMQKINAICKQIGVTDHKRISSTDAKLDSSGTGLAVISGSTNIDAYKESLIEIRESVLPALHIRFKLHMQSMTRWMGADLHAMEAGLADFHETKKSINDRLFNVGLYAGFNEFIIKVKDGSPAAYSEKIHIYQRKLYMDEECLANYAAGGMSFSNIAQFDEWISTPENMNRILPNPRSAVAFQVRRDKKDRSHMNLDSYISVRLADQDKYTFLYLRNGDQLFRLGIENHEFGEDLFPSKTVYNPSEPKMLLIHSGSVEKIISKDEYDLLVDRKNEYKRRLEALKASFPKDYKITWDDTRPLEREFSDVEGSRFDPDNYTPFDDSSVYLDDALEKVGKEINRYNRVSLIIQGILDRSEVFAPHIDIKTWIPKSFNDGITLIYDGSDTLYSGDKPDIEAYISKCNSQINSESILTGQLVYWLKREAEKENDRMDRRSRYGRSDVSYKYFAPNDDRGPDYVGRVANLHGGKATFHWKKIAQKWSRYTGHYDQVLEKKISVPISELFNVSAYTPGDYKKFFSDPRTRADYLKWAPFMLAAEDWHAGKIGDIDVINDRVCRSIFN